MYKIDLPYDEMPKKWYNINVDLPAEIPAPKNSKGKKQIESLPQIFSKGVLEQEFSNERYISIPNEVRDLYMRMGRPSPLFRAKSLEEKLNTPAKIYYKREDSSPTGSHKLNSAIPQAYYAKKDGIERLTTETGAGQWGTALSLACSQVDVDCTVYMVKVSFGQKPFRKVIMGIYGGKVHASPSKYTEAGRKILEENPDHPGSLGIAISEAIEDALDNEDVYYSIGSALNHVMLHQTIIGQEVKKQLDIAEETPDIMIGCVGGGSNFAGFTFPFIKDKIGGNNDCEFIGVEPSSCPTLTQGTYDFDFGDTGGLTPLIKMYSLGNDFIAPSVHSGGLRYHGMSPQVSLLKKEGFIEARSAHQNEVFEVGILFAKSEGVVPAPESTHAIKAVIDEAKKCKATGEEKTIIFNLSGHGLLDLVGYDKFLSNELPSNVK